jgi:hypothetical protein
MPSKPISKPKKKFDGAYATSLVLIAALGGTAGVFAGQLTRPQTATQVSAAAKTTASKITASETTPSSTAVKVATATKTAKTVTVTPTITATTKTTPVQTQTQPVRVTRQVSSAPVATTRGS